jgi:hypothetical protein
VITAAVGPAAAERESVEDGERHTHTHTKLSLREREREREREMVRVH